MKITAILILTLITFIFSKETNKSTNVQSLPSPTVDSCLVEEDRDTVIYAGRFDSIPKSKYNKIGVPTSREWLTDHEWKGNHISDKKMRKEFSNWKKQEIKKFISWISFRAKQESSKRGNQIPASLIAAQAILESNFGKSKIAVLGNNLFGKKWSKRDSSQYIVASDDDPNDRFTKFRSRWHSLRAHTDLLLDPNWIYYPRLKDKKPTLNNWYTALCASQNPKRAADLVKGGAKVYATACYSSCYVCKLKSIIKRYDLQKLD